MTLNLRDRLTDGKELRILVMATGPSIFYNVDAVKKYIEKYDPIIIGINGYLHGILSLEGRKYTEINSLGNKSKMDFTSIDSLVPDVMFTFLKYDELNTVDGSRIQRRKSDLFTPFIEDHKDFILDNNIEVMYPNDEAVKVSGRFGQTKWGDSCHGFNLNPEGYKGKEDKSKYELDASKNLFDNSILFKVKHGGEYVLAWALSQKPDIFATCGILDFPRKKIKKQRRGWFWLDVKRQMPSKMSVNQSLIVKTIRQKFEDKYTDLNLETWI